MASLNLIRLYEISKQPDRLIEMLRSWGLILRDNEYRCPNCGEYFKLISDCNSPDGWRWYCGNIHNKVPKRKAEKCHTRVALRTGTFFASSKLSVFQILGFVNLWVENASLKLIASQVDIDRGTAVDWSSFCREVIFDAFVVHKHKLGGPGITVEIDESKFGKRKYHHGHGVEGQWVFGGYERGTGRVFMVAVPDRGTKTLLPIIQDWIEEGTTIISDFWKSYDCLNQHGYEHLKVNHSLNFKDPETGAHTNAIESSWRAAKATISSSGRKKAHIPGNLARYMFDKRCSEMQLERTVEFCRLAGELYNPNRNEPVFENEVPAEDEFDLEV